MEKVIELDIPKFKELTEELYLKIIDNFGIYKVNTNQQLEQLETYNENLEIENRELRRRISDLKEIINEIIERI